jgi:hypothetical protein
MSKRERVNRAALLTGSRSRVASTTDNPLLPAAPPDPFAARPIDPATVTGTDAERLAAFEAAMERATAAADENLRAARARFAIEAGTALRAIQADGLHRAAGHPSFDAYVKARWSMSRSRAYQLMDAAPVMAVVSKILDAAPVESQAVAVASVLELHGEDAVRKVVDQARQESGKVTAATLTATARRLGYIPEQDGQEEPHRTPQRPSGAAAVARLELAVDALRKSMSELHAGILSPAFVSEHPTEAERCRELAREAARIADGIARAARRQ